jgi:hypothetical protein
MGYGWGFGADFEEWQFGVDKSNYKGSMVYRFVMLVTSRGKLREVPRKVLVGFMYKSVKRLNKPTSKS